MSIHQTIAFAPSAEASNMPYGARCAAGRHLRSLVWIARLAGVWGFAGAVLVQTALFCLVARLALQLDSVAMPGVAVSILGLGLGALAMLGSKSLTVQSPLAG